VSESFEFSHPDHFCAGAVGPKGQRVFYLQAREAGEVVSLKLEKQQVAALADYLERLLEDLPEAKGPATAAPNALEPLELSWAVGGLGVIYNERADRIILVAEEMVFETDEDDLADDEDDEDGPEPAEARLHLSRPQVVAFIAQARVVVAAGRPPCPYCGRPLDPLTGFCPCVN
jgi:uncharacterized repeat protein (TIGR03847 family)